MEDVKREEEAEEFVEVEAILYNKEEVQELWAEEIKDMDEEVNLEDVEKMYRVNWVDEGVAAFILVGANNKILNPTLANEVFLEILDLMSGN